MVQFGMMLRLSTKKDLIVLLHYHTLTSTRDALMYCLSGSEDLKNTLALSTVVLNGKQLLTTRNTSKTFHEAFKL